MSFDLRFVARNNKAAPTMDALAVWAETHPNFFTTRKDDITTIGYQNPDTGVYFTIYRSAEALDLNINYCRPTFFALEAADVLAALVSDFRLVVNDPNDGATILDYDANALVAWWREGNRFGCEALRDLDKEFLWMDEEKATDLWRYLRVRRGIVDAYDEYFVPEMVVVELDNKAIRGAVLTKPCSYIMPPVDVFFLKSRNVVWADRVMDVLQPYLTKLDDFEFVNAVAEGTIFDSDVMDVWESMYESLTPDFTLDQFKGKRLATDGFVDVSP